MLYLSMNGDEVGGRPAPAATGAAQHRDVHPLLARALVRSPWEGEGERE